MPSRRMSGKLQGRQSSNTGGAPADRRRGFGCAQSAQVLLPVQALLKNSQVTFTREL